MDLDFGARPVFLKMAAKPKVSIRNLQSMFLNSAV